MTKLLENAFELATNLPEDQQDEIAKSLLSELASEEKWQKYFSRDRKSLVQLANEALQEHQRSETEVLDPEAL